MNDDQKASKGVKKFDTNHIINRIYSIGLSNCANNLQSKYTELL